ncbi:hypothetical protein ACTG9Q_02020 [Actinokineospora sp. 24-640]
MQSAFHDISASLAPIAGAPMSSGPPPMPGETTGGGGGGKFTFEPDEIRAIVKDWLDLAEEYNDSIQRSDDLVRVQPPGDEYASEFHANAASHSGTLYAQSLQEKQQYCFSQAQKFQDALHDYLGTDRQNVRKLNTAGEGSSKPGGI